MGFKSIYNNIFMYFYAGLTKTSDIRQDRGVIRAQVGQNVTLQCFCQDAAVTFLSWYQQSLGGKPQLISTQMKHSTEADIYPEYKGRFKVFAQSGDGSNHLTITDLRPSDSATYFCGILEFNAIEFGEGAFLHVK
uniref:Ig-like domain-containing protein n=1 Tax=Monopterus albus TaxID=43700 RepID=A0A3Q3IYP2_MONAL